MEQDIRMMSQAELIVIINALAAEFAAVSSQRNELEEQLSTAQINERTAMLAGIAANESIGTLNTKLDAKTQECEGLRLANAMLKIQNSEHIKSNRALSNRLYTNGGLHAQA